MEGEHSRHNSAEELLRNDGRFVSREALERCTHTKASSAIGNGLVADVRGALQDS